MKKQKFSEAQLTFILRQAEEDGDRGDIAPRRRPDGEAHAFHEHWPVPRAENA